MARRTTKTREQAPLPGVPETPAIHVEPVSCVEARAAVEGILRGPPASITGALVDLLMSVAQQAAGQGYAAGRTHAQELGRLDWNAALSSTPRTNLGMLDLVKLSALALDAIGEARGPQAKQGVLLSMLNYVLDLRRDMDHLILVEEAKRLEADIGLMRLGDRFPYVANVIAGSTSALRFGASLIAKGMLPGSMVQPGIEDEDHEPSEEPPRA